jgi:hypothetical protein
MQLLQVGRSSPHLIRRFRQAEVHSQSRAHLIEPYFADYSKKGKQKGM